MNKLIKIYSHPRSGTHFLESFLFNNFYPNKNLSSDGSIYYGHWSNKILLEKGEPYHKLFGSHLFPDDLNIYDYTPKIYIYRDGRSVIASIYNSKYFNQELNGITFSDFLRRDIDWYGGLGKKANPRINVIQHWYRHVDAWHNLSKGNLLIISYEELKSDPEKIYKRILRKFEPLKYVYRLIIPHKVKKISQKVGLNPNSATIDSWKSLFNESDLSFFYNNIPSKKYLHES